jgi:RimJ/RimL family protein N-acetyltransferase
LKPSQDIDGDYEIKNEEKDVPFSERELQPIGVVTMQLARLEGVPAPTIPDIGFNMHESFHGKGYATEAAQGLMKYFVDTKGVNAFAGLTHKENQDAQRMFRRMGFKDHGLRRVQGVLYSGEEAELNVWTWGVGELSSLEDFGF